MEKRLATEKKTLYVRVSGLKEPAKVANNEPNTMGWTIVQCDNAETKQPFECAITTTRAKAQHFSASCFLIDEETMIAKPIINDKGEVEGKIVDFNTTTNPTRFFEVRVLVVPKPTEDVIYCYADKAGNLQPFRGQATTDKSGAIVVDANAKDLYILDAVTTEMSAKEFYVPVQSIAQARAEQNADIEDSVKEKRFIKRYGRRPDWDSEEDLKRYAMC